uniref:Uncharacterized protein n=1 Tax=Anguilla anguilla TaxID=7936 RepID=A0A0E9XLF7_ANGAN
MECWTRLPLVAVGFLRELSHSLTCCSASVAGAGPSFCMGASWNCTGLFIIRLLLLFSRHLYVYTHSSSIQSCSTNVFRIVFWKHCRLLPLGLLLFNGLIFYFVRQLWYVECE